MTTSFLLLHLDNLSALQKSGRHIEAQKLIDRLRAAVGDKIKEKKKLLGLNGIIQKEEDE